jgi:hypothetical protein
MEIVINVHKDVFLEMAIVAFLNNSQNKTLSKSRVLDK